MSLFMLMTKKNNNTGHYTIKSGYSIQFNVINKRNVQEEVVQPSLDALFQAAWATETSPKVKHFL